MSEQPNAELARKSFEILWSGDLDGFMAGLSPDVVWTNDVGAGPWAGRFEGRDAATQMGVEILGFFEGTFTHQLIDVLVGDDHYAWLVREQGTVKGQVFDNRAVWIFQMKGGTVTEVWTLDRDHPAVLGFWASLDQTVRAS
jgi:ketosteroid isomerase-like protein